MRHMHGRFLFCPFVFVILLVIASTALCAVTDSEFSEQAQAKLDAGDLTSATSLYTQLLQKFPNSPKAPDAQIKLAYIKVKLNPKSTQALLDAFTQVRAKYPSSPQAAEALARIGYIHTKSDPTQSIKDFTQFLTSNPDHQLAGPAQHALGRLYLRTNDLDKAESAFDKVQTTTGASTSIREEAAVQSGFVKIMKYYASKDKSHLQAAIDSLGRSKSSSEPRVCARADLGIAEARFLLRKYPESHAGYVAAAQTYASLPYFRGIALYGAALSSQEMGKMDQAASEYASFMDGLKGSTLSEKDAAWRAIALQSTSTNVRVSVEANGEWNQIPGIDLVSRTALGRSVCLYRWRHYEEAASALSELMQYLPDGDETSGVASQLLARCRKAQEDK